MDSNQSVSLSPTQATPHPSSTASAGISSIPIRAPLSSDSDFESALKTHSRNNSNGSSISGTSAKSFVSEEEEEDGFLSGEDGFETADEKHYEENLESAMEGEDILAKPALGSSRFSIAPPKARISADFDEDDDEDEVVDDGVEVPKGGVLEGGDDSEKIQIQDHSLIENGVVPGNPVLGSGELVEEKAPDVDEALVEDKVPDAAKALAEDKVPDVVEAENPNFADSVENGVLENGGKGDSIEEKPVLDSGSVTVDGEVDTVSEPSEEALVAHKEDILPESPKLDAVVNPEIEKLQEKEEVDTKPEPVEIGGAEEKEEVDTKPEPVEIGGAEEEEVDTKVEPVHKEVEEVPVEALVPDKHDDDILLNFPKLDAVVTGEFEVQEKKEVEPVPEKEIEEVTVEPLPEKKEYKDVLLTGLKPDVAENPEIGIQEKEEVETKVEAVDQKESEEVSDEAVVENKETMVPQMNSVANTEVEAQEKETETEDEAVQVKENVEVPNESIVPPVADKEDILQEGPKLDVIVQAKEDVETNVEALQKGSEEEVSGIKDEVDENKIEALSSSVDQPSPEDAVQVDSMLVTADKEVISTSEEASAVATETVPLVPTPVGVPDATPDVKPLEAEIGSPLPATTEETDISEVAESGVDIVEEDGPSSELRVSEKIPDLVEEDGPSGELSVSEKIPDLVENSAIETRELEQQDSKMQLLSSESNDAGVASQDDELKQSVSETPDISETTAAVSNFDSDVKEEAEAEVGNLSDYQEGEGSSSDEDNDELNFGSSGTAEQIMKELMRGSGVSFRSGAESSQDGSQRNDGQILMDSDEEVDTDEEGEGKELFDSAALAALLKAATSAGPEGGNVTITQDGSRLFNVERPAGLGSSMRSLKPTSQPSRPNIFTSSEVMAGGESENLSEEDKKKLEKLQHLRVKFLRLIHRLGHSPDEAIAAQVLYRMVLAAGRQTGQAFSLETAKKTATQLEAENADDLDFSLNILVLGKTGVGKSATINSIFGEEKAKIGAFEPSTTAVREITGTVGGVKIRILDTPGLKSSLMEQTFNRKVLSSVKKLTKKFPLDILLYVDRLDTQTRDLNDLPLLRAITNTLGSSIWRSAVVTLTHAASAPPDGPTGSPLSYEVFVAQRSHIIQQSIGQAVGDLRMMNPSLMNPVSLVENHPSCRKNREGQKILPNGQVWRPQLLLLCYSLKVLSEVTSLSKPQDPFDHRKLFGFRVRAPPLPYLLSSLLQSRAHPKLPDDQGGDNVDSDVDLEDLSDSDREEEEDEYDQLPPFKPLRKAQIAKLSKDQKKAYFDEYDYRVKLLQKKQWKEELKRMKEMKKRGKGQKDDFANVGEDAEQEQEGPAAVPVPLPDMVLPPSFDGDNPAYRYRFLEPTSQLLARPVLDTHGWDHDCGYDGVSLEENLAIAGRFPGGVAVQITKDKKEFNIHLDSSIAAKHGENGSSLAGFDIQTIGKQLGYIIRGETKFKNFKKNKTTGGVSVTFLGENVATGVKVEDQISIGKRLTLVASTGTIRSQGDAAYGANLEATLKDKDFPIGQDQSTLGLSLMRWRGDLALGANLQSQFAIGRGSKMSVRLGLNNKLSGQITVRTSSSEQLQLALVGLLPIAISLYRSIWPSTGESFSAY